MADIASKDDFTPGHLKNSGQKKVPVGSHA